MAQGAVYHAQRGKQENNVNEIAEELTHSLMEARGTAPLPQLLSCTAGRKPSKHGPSLLARRISPYCVAEACA